ncbi:NAD(P)-dependent oxidoreductase [Phytoactinopolyspora halotolerans]|uniref:NAD(P)-dependent oxidoreductase n=1 Tax=Phytoactinopolyspora halotolerans TaxID=1981512 RepID=A0A6L9SFA8_9ACTN|nr:NAD(P)-dependent oxidoreductase [Phytoactinopolyspora halotolerans]NEE03334.1 NAD(P)-dependent oxidoreductase [Phytoactinopolyspora halotolerans]
MTVPEESTATQPDAQGTRVEDVRRIGFIGLGTMGRPMAGQILAAGYELTVYDVAPTAVADLRDAGARAAASPREVAAASDVVICMLTHPDVVREVLLGADGVAHGVRPGAIVIDMSTSGPDVVRECAEALADRGARVIDAPVGKGPWAAEKGDLTILAGGEADVIGRAEAVLRCVGSEIHHCGPLGSGQVIKLANNLVSCANIAILAEAYALTRRAGADTDVLVKVMSHTSADSWQLRNTLIAKVLKGDLSPMFKLGLATKDMRLLEDLAGRLSAPFGCGRSALDWYERAEEKGMTDQDWGAVILVDEPNWQA